MYPALRPTHMFHISLGIHVWKPFQRVGKRRPIEITVPVKTHCQYARAAHAMCWARHQRYVVWVDVSMVPTTCGAHLTHVSLGANPVGGMYVVHARLQIGVEAAMRLLGDGGTRTVTCAPHSLMAHNLQYR